MAVLLVASGVAEAARCDLPAAFGIAAEESGGMTTGGSTVIVTAPLSRDIDLHAGDVIRQANGTRVDRCVDLESTAAEAFAKGLHLLVLVERDRGAFAVALGAPTTTVARAPTVGAEHPRPAHAPSSTVTNDEARVVGGGASASHFAVQEPPAAIATPRPREVAVLPQRRDVSPETIAAAAAAIRSLRSIEGMARLSTPIAVYERRLADAEAAIGALVFGSGQGAAAVHAAAEEVLAYHRTAAEIWRVRLEYLNSRGADRRGAAGHPMPYFADSQVPRWVGSYPFLQVTLISAPQESRFLQASGSWDAEQAINLLWSHAQETTDRLATWVAG